MKLDLAATSVNLYLEVPGTFDINRAASTSAAYRAWAQARDPTAVITLQGTAKLTSLRGGGTVKASDLKLDDLDFDGDLTAETVRVSTLTVTGKLTCTRLLVETV